ncbi:hypothetical protein Pan44_07100 [Caulifigura coniformis]|uniref:DUF1559 domain-containing protein n=1 Tax=Caulifigura coniformis TaxID=2527983 RepID=A0A517S988_9PLAN|nr:hypothetical protein Pan44_07100 [Caulifigura coniformis]
MPVCVFGLLVALILPAVRQARETARRTQARNNFKQWGLAVQNYADVYRVLPLGASVDADGVAHHGWPTRLIPFLAATPLYNMIDMNRPWDSPVNEPFMRESLWCEHSPFITAPLVSPEGYPLIHHAANPNVMHRNHCVTFDDMTAGTSETFLIGEAGGDFLPWGYPFNWRRLGDAINNSPAGYGLPGRAVTYVVMADGSVESLSPEIDPRLLKILSSAPPVATAEQADLPPRPEKFRSTGATWERPGVGSYRADVRIHPETQEILISIHADKGSNPDDPPTPGNIQSVVVTQYPKCTSLSVPIPLNRSLATVLSRLPDLAHLESQRVDDVEDVSSILKTWTKLTSLRFHGISDANFERLQRELPAVRILRDRS